MNDVSVYESSQLPDTLEDLTQFVLVGKAKLSAYMLKLQTVNKLSVAQEIRDQTLKEAQEISTALIAAEQRIGELLLTIPKASGQYAESKNRPVSKNTVVKEMGYSKDEASDYQKMAKNPEVVQRVIEDAIANGEIVTKTQVLNEIKAERKKIEEEMRDLKEERDYFNSIVEDRDAKIDELLSEFENIEPATVVPPDYQELKEKAKLADAYQRDYKKEKSRVDEKQRQILELQDRIKELERGSMEGLDSSNLSENVFYFCSVCNNFISNVGGLVWLTDRIADMPTREKEMFEKAARSFVDWSMVFKENVERSIHGEKRASETDTTVSLLTNKE